MWPTYLCLTYPTFPNEEPYSCLTECARHCNKPQVQQKEIIMIIGEENHLLSSWKATVASGQIFTSAFPIKLRMPWQPQGWLIRDLEAMGKIIQLHQGGLSFPL